MNFLGMGPLEVMLIVVLALIVVGPAKLPELMGQIGKAIGDFRRATSELSDEFNRTIQEELKETRQVVDETKTAFNEVRGAVDSTVKETHSAVTSLPAPQRVEAPVLEQPVANGTHEVNGTAAEASPLAEVASAWSWETAAPPAPEEPSPAAEPEGDQVAAEPVVALEETTAELPSHPAETQPPPPANPAPERTARDELQPPY